MDLRQTGLVAKCLRITQGHIDDPVMGQGGHARDGGGFLPAALGGRADEEAGHLAVEAAALPQPAGLVPEGLPLGGEVAVAGGDAEEEGLNTSPSQLENSTEDCRLKGSRHRRLGCRA